jgi:hypothetical protein
MTIPVGFLFALLIDLAGCSRQTRPLWDILIMLAGCLLLVYLLILTGDERLRLYHLLAVLTGAALYLSGLRRLFLYLCAKKAKRKRKIQPAAEGKKQPPVE